MSRLKQLSQFGQSIWIDYISRRLLTDGGLQRLIVEDGVCGLTSNPAIFEKAIAGGEDYREALIAQGINVNVTLLFSVEVYEQGARAYQRGLEQRAAAGKSVAGIASVASFFVSRIDTMVDAELDERAKSLGGAAREKALALRGRAAIASAKLAYQRYRSIFSGAGWDELKSRGAAVQRLLWGSTSTKNPAYPDTLYVDGLIGPDTVNTLDRSEERDRDE